MTDASHLVFPTVPALVYTDVEFVLESGEPLARVMLPSAVDRAVSLDLHLDSGFTLS